MEQEGRSLEDMHMLLYRAYHAQTNYLRPRMAQLGLGPGQPKLLAYLAVHGTSTQHEMAAFFEVDDAAISRMLDLLCFVNLSFHKTASVRFTRQREDSSRTSVALAPILSSPTTPRA